MDTIGLDLHKRESQLCILAEDGTMQERRIVTSRVRVTAILGNRPRACILLEASTESEWVAQHLESLGHEVIVADPNYAPMYATRARRVKTDKRDARALAEALRVGAYRIAHRVSAERRHVRAEGLLQIAYLLSDDDVRAEEAEPLFRRALGIRRRLYGDGSPWVGNTLHDLSEFLSTCRSEPLPGHRSGPPSLGVTSRAEGNQEAPQKMRGLSVCGCHGR